MGQGSSLKGDISSLQEKVNLVNKTTFLTYAELLKNIQELNEVTRSFTDRAGKQLCFSIKKGTDTGILWKTTIRIRCLKVNTNNNNIESTRLLRLRQFIAMHKEIVDQIKAFAGPPLTGEVINNDTSGGEVEPQPSTSQDDNSLHEDKLSTCEVKSYCQGGESVSQQDDVSSLKDKEFLASAFFSSEDKLDSCQPNEDLNECCVCMENKACIMLSCSHEFCEICIDSWTRDKSHSNCPLCRKKVKGKDDTWVLTDKNDSSDYENEVKGYLVGFADR